MNKLKQMSVEELRNEYYTQFGKSADREAKERILAALFYGKRIESLTHEEIVNVEEEMEY